MKSFLKRVHDHQIGAILAITGIVVMCLTLALTLNGKVLQDNLLKPKMTTQVVKPGTKQPVKTQTGTKASAPTAPKPLTSSKNKLK